MTMMNKHIQNGTVILKERGVPERILLYDAVLRRLPKHDADQSKWQDQLRRMQAGFAGESRVDQEWHEITFPEDYLLLHDLLLVNEAGGTHQIDTLFLCSRFALVIEVKNIVGKLDFNPDTHQFIRLREDGTIEGFRNPYDQVKRHVRLLEKMFRSMHLRIPIEPAIIFSNSSTVLSSTIPRFPIFHVTGLQEKLLHFHKWHEKQNHAFEKIQAVAFNLLQLHLPSPTTPDLTAQLLNKLQKGVLCPVCIDYAMDHNHGKWHCPACGQKNQQPFLQALQDYRVLYGNTITNRQFRAFFGVESRHTASHLLSSLGYKTTGTFKDRKYIIPKNLNS